MRSRSSAILLHAERPWPGRTSRRSLRRASTQIGRQEPTNLGNARQGDKIPVVSGEIPEAWRPRKTRSEQGGASAVQAVPLLLRVLIPGGGVECLL